jgi:hypothetical protein
MSPALRRVGLLLSFAGVAVPGLLIALATFAAISASLSSPSFAGEYALAYALWWFGLAAAFALPGLVARRTPISSLVAVGAVLLVGMAACGWLEWSAFVDPKRIAPVGLFVVPFVGAVLFAALSKNAG